MWAPREMALQQPSLSHDRMTRLLCSDDEEEAGMGELHKMIQRVMKQKQAAARKKQLGIIQVCHLLACWNDMFLLGARMPWLKET